MVKKILLAVALLAAVTLSACAAALDEPTVGTADSISDSVTEDTSEAIEADTTAPAAPNDIAAIIDENLDIIMSGGELASVQEYIDAHPEAFEAIVALGEAALPYLDEVGSKYEIYGASTHNCRCFAAMSAAYAIKPELYDLVYPSPDGKYEIKATVNSFDTLWDPFAGITYNVVLIERESGAVLTEPIASTLKVDYGESIVWSPDGKYAAVSYGYRHMFSEVDIFDAVRGERTELPDEQELESLLGKDMVCTVEDIDVPFDRLHCYLDAWGTDTVRIRLELRSAVGGGYDVGWYVYDLAERKVAELVYYDSPEEASDAA